MSKNIKCRLRAIVRTDEPRRFGLFPYQDQYKGKRLFAVFANGRFLDAFEKHSAAVACCKEARSFWPFLRCDIVLMEAK